MLCSIVINFGTFLLPLPTAVIPPNPFFFNSGCEITVHFILFFFEIFLAKFANVVGVHSFGGKFPILFVNIAPSATDSAILIAFKILLDLETMIVMSGDLSTFSALNLSNLYNDIFVPSTIWEIDETELFTKVGGTMIENSFNFNSLAVCAILPETNLIVSFVMFSFFPRPARRIL